MAWRRRAARVILLDRSQNVLLLSARDPANPAGGSWWEVPGGGIDHGESSAEAAARELYEEAGIVADEIGPCIWRQRVRFRFGGIEFDSDDHVHVAWTDEADAYQPTHLEALEAMAFQGARWWPVSEVVASDERFLPEPLVDFLPRLAAGDIPDEPVQLPPA